MRVVHVVRYGSIRGGAETYVASLATGFRQRGHDTRLVYALDPDPTRPEVAGGVRVPGLVDGTEDRAGLRSALDSLSPDLVHVHLPDEPWVTSVGREVAPTLLALHDHRLNCPVGTRYHTAWQHMCNVTPGLKCLAYNVIAHCGSLRANLTLKPYLSWRRSFGATRRSDVALQVFSEHMADRLEPLMRRRPFVTPYPTPPSGPPSPVSTSTSDLLLAPEGSGTKSRVESDPRPVVVAIGRLNREKGFRQLLEAMSFVSTPCHLVVIGDGHDRDALEQRASRTIGGHRITFTGWLDASERDRWLARSRLVAVPSMWPEPFGIVGLEAMAAGRPVVAFDAGGITQWLEHGANGLLVEHGNVPAFGAAIVDLLENDTRAQSMGEEGRRRATERFALDSHVDALLALYRHISSR